MIEITLNETYGWKTGLRALRRPFNKERDSSWSETIPTEDDLRIMRALVHSGDDHAKVMRMIGVGLTIKAPRYWWTEMDCYKLGRFDADYEMLSESTMHRKKDQPFTEDDFEYHGAIHSFGMNEIQKCVCSGEASFEEYKATMPEGFLQTRDVILNYQALRHIYKGRRNHRLSQWKTFCSFIEEQVPFAREVITIE